MSVFVRFLSRLGLTAWSKRYGCLLLGTQLLMSVCVRFLGGAGGAGELHRVFRSSRSMMNLDHLKLSWLMALMQRSLSVRFAALLAMVLSHSSCSNAADWIFSTKRHRPAHDLVVNLLAEFVSSCANVGSFLPAPDRARVDADEGGGFDGRFFRRAIVQELGLDVS